MTPNVPISDPAPMTSGLQRRRYCRVRCIRFVRQIVQNTVKQLTGTLLSFLGQHDRLRFADRVMNQTAA
jgi:hypothetical protein